MKQKYEEGYLKYVKEKGATKKDLNFSEKMSVGEYKINYDKDPAELLYKDKETTSSIPFEWTDANLLDVMKDDLEEIYKYFTSGKLNEKDSHIHLETLFSLPRIIKLQLAKKDLFINPTAKDAMKKHEQYLREVK
jgi:hypothetical protein|tara:strand:- start:1306 stop:1710 length:405 start_codon:yes stop_codon:yes gene_type:complete